MSLLLLLRPRAGEVVVQPGVAPVIVAHGSLFGTKNRRQVQPANDSSQFPRGRR